MAIWRLIRCNPWSHGGVDYAVKEDLTNTKTIQKNTEKTSVGAN
jgi:putative component of membrane protein insertase Oxa1/YidC/SpoIIIJ protein YidD